MVFDGKPQAPPSSSSALSRLGREWPVIAAAAAGGIGALALPGWAPLFLGAAVGFLIFWLVLRRKEEPAGITVTEASADGNPGQAAAQPAPAAPVPVEPVARISATDLAAALPDPLVIFEASSAIVYANSAARQAFGTLQEGMSLLLKFRTPEMQQLIESIVAGGTGTLGSYFSQRVPVEATYKVTGARVGAAPDLFFLLFQDQSESLRIDRMRSDFIANASHELRTPLASISGFVETLRGPARNDPAARERFLQIMQEQTARMSRLIDDLLSLSRLEMKSPGRPSGTVDIRQVIDSVVDSLKPLASELGVSIETQFATIDTTVPGERDELFQVFENLVENACKYGQSGGRVVVSIAPDEAGGEPEIVVSVRDFGPGIAEEHIPRITERFYRVDVQSGHARKGTGLGLAIVKHILTRYGARLSIRSMIGEGSVFTVHLPAR